MSIYNIASRATISALLVVGLGVSGSLGALSSPTVHTLLNSAVLQKVKGSIEANPYAGIALTGTAAVGLTAACILGAQRWAGKNQVKHVQPLSLAQFVLVVKNHDDFDDGEKADIISALCEQSMGNIASVKTNFEKACKAVCGDQFVGVHIYKSSNAQTILRSDQPVNSPCIAFIFTPMTSVNNGGQEEINFLNCAHISVEFSLDRSVSMQSIMQGLRLVLSKKMVDEAQRQAGEWLNRATQQLTNSNRQITDLQTQVASHQQALEQANTKVKIELQAEHTKALAELQAKLQEEKVKLEKECQNLTEQKTSSDAKAMKFAAQAERLEATVATIKKSNDTLLNDLLGLALWKEYSSETIKRLIEEVRGEGLVGLKKLFEFLHTYSVPSSTAAGEAISTKAVSDKKDQLRRRMRQFGGSMEPLGGEWGLVVREFQGRHAASGVTTATAVDASSLPTTTTTTSPIAGTGNSGALVGNSLAAAVPTASTSSSTTSSTSTTASTTSTTATTTTTTQTLELSPKAEIGGGSKKSA